MNTVPTLSVMIVDDEAPARARLRDLLADVAAEAPNVLVAEADNGWRAIEALKENAPDVMLVDIRMPEMDGIELARHVARLDPPPAIIFVTAYDSYAVRAFELNAIDYLVKPVRAQRLAAALQKAVPSRRIEPEVLAGLQKGARTHLSCHERGRLLLIPVADILYLKADLKYVMARTEAREYLLEESLTHLEQEFSERFIRLHRGALVAREAIAGFEKSAAEDAETQWQALVRGVPDKLPVSRRQWTQVKSYARQISS
ncbi:MAG: LytTR family DNA-binding domain-containing protein [Candidatus Accumulibacter sp.]|jgi:two-component system response regulator AlgR|nr:LytTR family DNA-binding domain-containing protein [Accumulibacter sp.]